MSKMLSTLRDRFQQKMRLENTIMNIKAENRKMWMDEWNNPEPGSFVGLLHTNLNDHIKNREKELYLSAVPPANTPKKIEKYYIRRANERMDLEDRRAQVSIARTRRRENLAQTLLQTAIVYNDAIETRLHGMRLSLAEIRQRAREGATVDETLHDFARRGRIAREHNSTTTSQGSGKKHRKKQKATRKKIRSQTKNKRKTTHARQRNK